MSFFQSLKKYFWRRWKKTCFICELPVFNIDSLHGGSFIIGIDGYIYSLLNDGPETAIDAR